MAHACTVLRALVVYEDPHTSTMKQELIYLRHTGSYTLTCADILLHLLLGSVDSREGMQAGYRPSKSVSSSRKLSKSMISQQSSCRGWQHSQWRTVGACSGSDSGLHFGLSLLSSEFSSETGGRRSHHCLGFQQKVAFCSRETVTFLGARPSRHLRVQVPFNGYTTDA